MKFIINLVHFAFVVLMSSCFLFTSNESTTGSDGAASAIAKQEITFTNQFVGDKKVWLPETVTVKEGTEVTIKLVNNIDEPHGFHLPPYVEQVVVINNETKMLPPFVAKKGDYEVSCHLHPPHVGAELKVVD